MDKFNIDLKMASIGKKLQGFDTRLRDIERNIEKCELREQQIIIVLKQLLDLSYKRRKDKRLTVKDILESLDKLVRANISEDNLELEGDMIGEIISKGQKF